HSRSRTREARMMMMVGRVAPARPAGYSRHPRRASVQPRSSSESEDPRALLRRARAALQAGQVDQALKDLEAAYERAVSTGDRTTEGESLVQLSRALEAKGSLDQAVLATERAIEAAKRASIPRVEADALVRDSEVRRRIGDVTRARHRLEDAARVLDQAYA